MSRQTRTRDFSEDEELALAFRRQKQLYNEVSWLNRTVTASDLDHVAWSSLSNIVDGGAHVSANPRTRE